MKLPQILIPKKSQAGVPHEWVLEMDEARWSSARSSVFGTGACGIFNGNCGSFHNMAMGQNPGTVP